ncbi:MAG: (d)CMP kinase, partial [Bacteroidetes bacterium]|nr:(d)CMP kinase [Bacteroidota bacterium]
ETNLASGRAIAGSRAVTLEYYESIVKKVKQFGYGLKINTVVNRSNFDEDMKDFIHNAKPKRWKVLQVLPILGQNDLNIDDFKISEAEFQTFITNHSDLEDITNIVPETNSQIKGSYAMVDPAGRFFDNTTGTHNYSSPILQVGVYAAIKEVHYDFSKFVSRGGIYDWANTKGIPSKITISGEVASGKSTVGKLLAERLSYTFESIGNQTRTHAENLGKSIVEFQRDCLLNPDLDKEIDVHFSTECNLLDNLIVDYRLGFKFINNGYHIYLKISERTSRKTFTQCR